jgi:membrane protease YdiL (CAAX protease family)
MAASGTQPAPTEIAPPPRPGLVAPLWHTGLLLFLLLVPLSWWLPIKKMFVDVEHANTGLLYLMQLESQWVLFFITVLGLMARRTSFQDLVGERWRNESDFFRDTGFGLVLVILNVLITLLIVFAVHPTRQEPTDPLSPHTMSQLAGFIPIALTAGFSEEVMFRGYLQRQLYALTKSYGMAIVVQAVVFSLSHGYTLSLDNLTAKFIAGLLYGTFALYRKSLLPGMLGHAAIDCLVGFMSVAIS